MVMNLRHTTCYMDIRATPLIKSLAPYLFLDPNIFFGLPNIYCDLAALQSCWSQLHAAFYFPTTILLVDPIFSLHYTCRHHPGMVWLAHNVSPSAHICHTTSNLSRFLPTILLQNSSLPSTCRLFYIECCSIKYIYIYIHVTLSHVQYRSLCIQQSTNKFSNPQLSVSTVA